MPPISNCCWRNINCFFTYWKYHAPQQRPRLWRSRL